jgi:monothiol glutaredoxin
MSSDSPFNIINKEATAVPYVEESRDGSPKERIEKMIHSSPIFIFMKGTPNEPQCGFSFNTVEIFKSIGKPFKTFDVLSDYDIRDGVKEFSNWPTIPQIYVNGEFIGGNDIITEMYQSGELATLIKDI